MEKLLYLFAPVAGYLLGSINTSILVGKLYGMDVRDHGSGNAGATNTLRVLGKRAAAFVFLGDALKGVLACVLGWLLAGTGGMMLAGGGAVAGHNWPLYFGFKGGKGVLTTAAVIFCIDYRLALLALLVFIVVLAITKFVSLASITAAIAFPILCAVFERGFNQLLFALLLSATIVFRHRTNIKRLLGGTESKVNFKKIPGGIK